MKDMEHKKETVTVIETTTRKVCSRQKDHFPRNTTEHATKKVTEVTERKHVGVKFNGEKKKKLTVPVPFSFDTGPKIRKEKALLTPENPAGKKKDESLKVSKEPRSSSKNRSTSPEKTPKSSELVPGYARETRCSRSKAVHASTTTDSPANSPTTAKSPATTSNATKSHDKASKGAPSAAQPSNIVKSHVHFSAGEKSEVRITSSEKSNVSKNKHDSSKIDVTQPKLPNGLELKVGNLDARPLNGSPEPDSPDGITTALANGVNFHCEYSETKIVESSMKSSSKIPRKKYGAHSGLKFPANFREATIPLPFNIESRCSNLKKENMQIEANQMKITNMVNN